MKLGLSQTLSKDIKDLGKGLMLAGLFGLIVDSKKQKAEISIIVAGGILVGVSWINDGVISYE